MLQLAIERVEKCAFKAIYLGLSYEEALVQANIPPILVHLNKMVLNQFIKMKKAHHPLHHLIPVKQADISQRETRGSKRLRILRHRLVL